MRIRPSTTAVAALAVAALAAAPAAEAAEPGPGSEAGASAAQVDEVLTVSGTAASTRDGGHASATVVGIGGEQVVGGSQEGEGTNGGEMVGSGETENGELTVGGWDATVEDDRSSSESSVLHAQQAEEDGLAVTALRSRSEATDDGGSRASSTGAQVSHGDHRLTILHAEASSNGEGGSYLIGLDDERIATSEDANGECRMEADPLADVLCLYATATGDGAGEDQGDDGGAGGSTGFASGVLDSDLLDGATGIDLVTSETSETPAAPEQVVGDVTVSPPASDTPLTPAADPAGASGALPRTGGGTATSLLGLLGVGGAVALRRAGR